MNLLNLLENRHNKATTTFIAKEIIKSPKLLSNLIQIIKNDDVTLSQRAAWPMSVVAETNPELFIPYLDDLVKLLENTSKHSAVKRNILRAFQFIKQFPNNIEGQLINQCFKLLNSNSEPIAIRVFSMQVLFNISIKYPEIQSELRESILFQFENQSAGFQSRGKRILKQLSK